MKKVVKNLIAEGNPHTDIADILAQRKEEQKMTALRLHLLGWTNEEVGDTIGMSRNAINDFQQNFSELKKSVKTLIAEGHPHTDIADILAQRKEEQKMTVFRLHLLGWTQEEIGDKLFHRHIVTHNCVGKSAP